MRTPLYTILFSLIALSATFALTPKERELVQGLTKINTELRQQIATDEAAIQQKDTDYLFLQQKNEALTLKLDATKKVAAGQAFELSIQQQKLHDQMEVLDQAEKDRDTARAGLVKKTLEAHRNAVQRDICLVAFALAVTVLVMTCAGQIIAWIVRIYPPAAPYGALIEIALAIGTFAATYGAARGTIAIIASRL